MAHVIKQIKARFDNPPGRLLRILGSALLYAGLLLLVCFYFSGNGAFIYEGF